ncbi:hypothetical protein E4U52_007204 [Claviceps spartinae]|nr:hypothetical protein E4U52_007204 [Claviceps spartinae]
MIRYDTKDASVIFKGTAISRVSMSLLSQGLDLTTATAAGAKTTCMQCQQNSQSPGSQPIEIRSLNHGMAVIQRPQAGCAGPTAAYRSYQRRRYSTGLTDLNTLYANITYHDCRGGPAATTQALAAGGREPFTEFVGRFESQLAKADPDRLSKLV